jgi:anti-sigma B factor antagonist
MGTSEGKSKLMSHVQHGVAVIQFTDTKVLDQRNINLIGAELAEMVEKRAVRKMLINLQNVEYLSSSVLGKLLSLHKALRVKKGTLKLCCIAPSIFEVFKITSLDKVFDIFPTEAEAMDAFRLS